MMIRVNMEEVAIDWVEFPRKENEYTIAAHPIGKGTEITIWVNVGSAWQGPIPAEGAGPISNFGEWHHYASTYDGEECKMLLDGEEIVSQNIGGPVNKTDAVMRLSNGMAGRLMTGMLDEFILANHVLTVNEIKDYMNRGANMVLAVDPKSKVAVTWGKMKK